MLTKSFFETPPLVALREEPKGALSRGTCVHTRLMPDLQLLSIVRTRLTLQDALIGEHVEVQKLLLSRKGKVFRKGIGLVEHTVPEAEPGCVEYT